MSSVFIDLCWVSTNYAADVTMDGRMTWEYMVREFNVQDVDKILLVEEFLNEVGKDGWELVSVATTRTANFTHLMYLKRATALAERVDFPPPKLQFRFPGQSSVRALCV